MALTIKDLKAIKQIVDDRNFNDRDIKAIKQIVDAKTLSDKEFERMEDLIKVIVNEKVENLENNVSEYRADVVGMKAEVLLEVQKLRDEVTTATHQYKRTNKRIDLIDERLGITTSNLA